MSLPGKKSGCPGLAFAENDLVLVKLDERASINALTFMVPAPMNWHFAILQLICVSALRARRFNIEKYEPPFCNFHIECESVFLNICQIGYPLVSTGKFSFGTSKGYGESIKGKNSPATVFG